nr:low-specificity L-threonine aldolase [Anaerolineae bacterium]
MDSIDLRSDTVTWPTPEMREAMANARVGDDVWGDDPSVIELEALAAERLGKEAALLTSSGTQGNLVAILTHCQRGDEMIMGQVAHTFQHEAGGAAALGGVHPHTVPVQPDGTLRLDDIRYAIRDTEDIHYPITRLVTLENTQGDLGGIPITAEYTQSVRQLCDEYGLKLHIDGARIWNAAAALGCDVRKLTEPGVSISFCLSKGLCAPVGAMLCGSAAFIARARRIRKMLGGGMRQAGILAAAGIIAVETMTQRLAEDHKTARMLAEGLASIEGIQVSLNAVQTNIVFYTLDATLPFDAYDLSTFLERSYNIKLGGGKGQRTLRAVTHYWITEDDVAKVVEAFRHTISQVNHGALSF